MGFDQNMIFLLAVVVHLRATGDAPILKQTKFKVLLNGVHLVLLWVSC